MKKKWLEKLLIHSIIFTLFLFVIFFVLKCFFVLYSGIYHNAIGEVKNIGEYVNTFFNGLRYDARNVAFFSIIYFILGLIFARSKIYIFVLWIYALLVVFFVLFIGIAEVVFYEIYDDVFNANLLGLFFDDQRAIFYTGTSGQYHLTSKVITWLVLSFIFMWIYTKTFHNVMRRYDEDSLSIMRSSYKESTTLPIVLLIIYAIFMMICINATFGFKAVNLDQISKPVENNFLRKISPGALRNIYLVYNGYRKISKSSFSDYIDQSPLEVVREYFELTDMESQYDLKKLLSKQVSNSQNTKIDHIFYIIAESLSEWHFNAEFDEIALTSGLKSLFADNHGVKIGVFLENADSAIKSLDVQLTGLFQTEISTNALLGTLAPFITAPAIISKDLGYKNNFYYGGSGIWQKLDQYTQTQGFDRIYYNTHIINNAKLNDYSPPYEGLWGAYDHHLFALIRDNAFKERSTPSFNMILTTSNHPPYDVPLEQFNVPTSQIEAFFAKDSQYRIKNPRLMGHIYYQDKVITRFIQEVSRVLPNSLFIITGNHYDREYPKAQTLRVKNTIPLIIYSPILEIKKISNVGSHIDIAPSIVELVAPHHYIYHSFGNPLVSNDEKVLSENHNAMGYFAIATERFIYNQEQLEYFHKAIARNNDQTNAQALYKRLNQARALSWWILKNGYIVKED